MIGDKQRPRANRRDIGPAAIRARHLPDVTLVDTNADVLTATLTDGSQATITSTISVGSGEAKLGSAPYMMAIFESSVSEANWINGGSSVGNTDYLMYGPMAIPDISINNERIGTDGKNIVFKTSITNNSGTTQGLIFVTNTRVMVTRGGQQSGSNA